MTSLSTRSLFDPLTTHTPRPAQVVGFAPYERRVMELIRNSKVSVLNTRGHAQGGPRH